MEEVASYLGLRGDSHLVLINLKRNVGSFHYNVHLSVSIRVFNEFKDFYEIWHEHVRCHSIDEHF
jgi:hypothetical protein